MKSLAMSGLLLALSFPVACLADDTARTPASVPAGEAQPAADAPIVSAPSAPSAPLRTLDAIEALRPDIDWTPDPFARRPNRFDGAFNPGPTPEEIALQHGGYLMYGMSRALYKGGAWLNRVTGGPAQIQAAQARDVPLDDEQIARAARWAGSTINGD